MARIISFLLLLAVTLYGVWPYYGIYRLDQALSQADAAAIAPFVDLQAIQHNYKTRLSDGVDRVIPESDRATAPMLEWLAQGLQELGGQALDQAMTLDVARSMLRQATLRATEKRPAYFLAGVDYAFFSSPIGFQIRLGEGEHATHVSMALQGLSWRITDITDASAAAE